MPSKKHYDITDKIGNVDRELIKELLKLNKQLKQMGNNTDTRYKNYFSTISQNIDKITDVVVDILFEEEDRRCGGY